MAINYNPRIVTDGLILALDAGNTKSYPGSGTTWTDLSGNGNNGTLTNGPTFDSGNGGSIVFDGSNDVVNCGNDSTLSPSEITLSIWCNPSGFGEGNFGRFFQKVDQYVFFFDNTGGSGTNGIRFGAQTGSSQVYTVSNVVTLNEWANFAVSLSGSTASFYKNGSLVGSSGGFSSLPSTSNDLTFGNNTALTRTFNGKLSQGLIYNRGLTASEIQQNYNALRGRY